MSTSSKRFGLGDIDEDEIEIPKGEMISRSEPAAQTEQGSGNVQAITPKTPRSSITASKTTPSVIQHLDNQTGDDRNVMQLATTNFVPQETRIKTSMSITESLNKLLDKKVYDLRMKGFKKITREAVLEDALKLYFGVK